MNWFARVTGTAVTAAAMLLLAPAIAAAHEHRDIADGTFSIVVGFASEPAYTGFLNGLSLEVFDHGQASSDASGGDEEAEGAPVDGLEETLHAEIIYGDQKMALVLEPRWNTPGAYDAWVVPTAAGDYTFHIWGTIGETAIDETFTSSPEGFSSVYDQSTIQFPQSGASNTGASVFGTVSSDGGFNWGAGGAALAGLMVGAAGLLLLQRRSPSRRLVRSRVGAGD